MTRIVFPAVSAEAAIHLMGLVQGDTSPLATELREASRRAVTAQEPREPEETYPFTKSLATLAAAPHSLAICPHCAAPIPEFDRLNRQIRERLRPYYQDSSDAAVAALERADLLTLVNFVAGLLDQERRSTS
jgi:hypothetical protein